ncbi:MAG: HAMP domain-containing sensor histidine kinase [Terriglobia bacterium]
MSFVFGEMRVADEQHELGSKDRLDAALEDLGAGAAECEVIRQARGAAPMLPFGDIALKVAAIQAFLRWFYTLMAQQDHLEIAVERATHEIQTRMQALLSKAENLAGEISELRPHDARERALGVLDAVKALITVLETSGNSLGAYRVKTCPILPIVLEAASIYSDEAEGRGIKITYDMPLTLEAEISEPHFKHAINNLVHNAVKYSFTTVAGGRHRWVRISGRADKTHLVLTISNYGVGILPEEIRSGSLFKLGVEGRLTRGEFRPGSGKGLCFVHRVIEAHHGRIEVQSELQAADSNPEFQPHHNRFTIYVPLRQPGTDHYV